MSKEAKVGLLLGLAFIVGVVLVLRGSHGNEEAKLEEELSINFNTSDSVEEESVDIPSAVDKLFPRGTPIPAVAKKDPHIRYESSPPRIRQYRTDQTVGPITIPPTDPIARLPSLTEQADTDKSVVVVPRTAEKPPQRIYVVGKGDCLERIALRVYGKVEGKKRKNIDGIYKANPDKMPSKDVVHLGPKLVIQRLPSDPGVLVIVAEKQTARQDKPEAKQSSGQEYLVRKNDSLWDIAEAKLDSGVRYKEIKKLNGLKSDDIYEGQKLRLPTR